jgi:cyclic pyranopterin phosphate synthase
VEARLEAFRPLVKLPSHAASETAVRLPFDDGIGECGIIVPVSQPFCGRCSRVRLTSDGKIRTCLSSQPDDDLYAVMQRGGSEAGMKHSSRARFSKSKPANPHRGAGLPKALAA